MEAMIASPFMGIVLCLVAYQIGLKVHKTTGVAVLNPLLIAIGIVIIVIQTCHIPLEAFNKGGDLINLFLGPATVALAIPMYEHLETLKTNILPILISTAVGALTSITSVILLCKLFGLSDTITASLIPKSVTTPIAIEVASKQGGIAGITIGAVVITGILGAVVAPSMIKVLKLEKHSVAAGLAIGASSHAMGTSKAIQIGELEGAMSGLAIGMTGIFTVLFSLFL
ncbi:LrgB family protein [Niameybacter massiliensis]|uniref:LrgB family protein n=1 Tax=Holtiella tumoricola TaxID=3018743 RepID=A0AA42J018_9FIRM|nr:LrgB family protein [Holtiella tumoricola]MDA3730756.1 LrgB family protein [Holtiella tumoricola]